MFHIHIVQVGESVSRTHDPCMNLKSFLISSAKIMISCVLTSYSCVECGWLGVDRISWEISNAV